MTDLTPADRAPATPIKDWVRVVVVVDWTRQRVHGLTCDNAEARQWARDIVANHGGNPLAATMTVSLVDPAHQR